MSRPCTICTRPECAEIEEAIAARVPYRRISRRYGVSISAISRHLKAHVVAEMLEVLTRRVEAHRERELAASLGPELVEWMRAEEAEFAEMLGPIVEGVGELEMSGTMEGDDE
jgi:DNA-binding transcriptional ArsR family regulator